jgi:hypothetical protein
MWYLDRFSLTPFDERYMKVPFEFMEFSYIRFMENYGYEELRDAYLLHKKEEKKKMKAKEDLEVSRGVLEESYGKEEAEKILNHFAEVQANANRGD